jgi:hypothetical protein
MATERMIVWEGPSQITGRPIIALATGVPTKGSRSKSGNTKTGDMIQIAIMSAEVNPTEGLKTGQDENVCGKCPFSSKPNGGDGSCYTHKNLRRGFAQTATWKTHAQKGSVAFDVTRFAGQRVRFGSYGDPAAVPVEVWQAIVSVAEGVTSYTHQWRTCPPEFAEFSMASTDNLRERKQARLRGFRSFMPREAGSPKPLGMITCPASKEMGMRTTCEQCMMCGGTSASQVRDITIERH